MYAFKKIVAGGLMVGMLVPALAFADTNSTIQTLLDQIKALQTQIVALAQQQQTVATLVATLKQGDTSENVRVLQALLAADPSIYPEGTISGHFGRLTAQAVKRFQKKHGLEQVGNVGPQTLRKLQELMNEHPLSFASATSSSNGGQGSDKRPCAIVPPGHLIAPGWLKKHSGESMPVVPVCQTVPKGIKNLLEGNDNHGTTTTPDTTAPVISGVSVSSIASTTATVLWSTNEAATSKVYYSTTSPVALGTALSVGNTSLATVHTLGLTGLTASSTVYFVVESKDASNNTATTTTASFVTTN